jgi:hypothetical protein
MAGAGLELPASPDLAPRFVCPDPQTRQSLVKKRLKLVRVGSLPGGVPARVTKLDDTAYIVLDRDTGDLVQGIRGTASPPTAGAG